MDRTGSLFIVSAPSGAGKTTLCRVIMSTFDRIGYSVSHTTRKPRKGEVHGTDYYFVSEDEFDIMVNENKLAEWAKVHGNHYGTSVKFLSECLKSGNDVLLDVDVNGAKQILKKFPEAITIFIMPPSMDILKERLLSRDTDALELIENRLEKAVEEIAENTFYKYIVVNDDLDLASKKMKEIINESRRES